MQRIAVALAAIAVAAVIVVVWQPFSSGANPGPPATPTEPPAPTDVPAGPPITPIWKAPGEFPIEAEKPDKRERNQTLFDTAAKLPLFEGTVAGFRIHTTPEATRAGVCASQETVNQEVPADELPFRVGTFLPGSEEYPPALGANLRTCPDSAVYYAFRAFSNGLGGWTVTYVGGELAFHNDYWKLGYVEEGTIHGVPAFFGKPLSDDGLGSSIIAWPVKGGYLTVGGQAIPWQSLLMLAEGVSCVTC